MWCWDLEEALLQLLKGFSHGNEKGSCEGPRTASYRGQIRREPRNIKSQLGMTKISSLVEETSRDWIGCGLG